MEKQYIKGLSTYDTEDQLFTVTIGEVDSKGKPKDKVCLSYGRSEKEADKRADELINLLSQ